jgi:rhomboid protease GluP
MAFGFSPKHSQDLSLEHLDKEHFLVIGIEAALKLNWNVSFVSETGFIAYTKFSMSSYSEEVTIKISDETVNIKSECAGSQIFDWGKNKKNVETFLSYFEEVKNTITTEEIETKLTELRQNYASKEDDFLNKPPLTTKGKITDFFSIFKPTKDFFVTPILLNINILIFILMVATGVNFFIPDSESLLNWGANFRPITLEGQSWRLLTACFLHIGIFHLLLNMYALLYIGVLLEPYLGKTRFLAAYLITGIAASITSLWWNDLTISAGASGAIFGMYGVFLALLTTNLLDKSVKKTFLTSIAVFVGYNILNGLKPNSGIDNAAHIGGLLSGLMVGYAFIPSLKKFNSAQIKLSTIGVLTAVLLIVTSMVYKSLPNDFAKYDEKMKEFVSMESMALSVYNLPEGTPNEKLLYELKDRGIYYWNENIKLIDSCQEMDLPEPIRARNAKLREYCELRIKSYELLYKSIDEDTDIYENTINDYNKKIENIIDELAGKQ